MSPGLLQVVNVRWFNAEADYALRQGLGLAHRGWRVRFLAVPGSPIWTRVREAGLEVLAMPDLRRPNPVAAVAAWRTIHDQAARGGMDLVNFHRSEGSTALAAMLRSRGTPASLVRTRGDVRRIRSNPGNRAAYRGLFDLLVASGERIAREMEEDLRLPAATVKVLYYGVDTRKFRPLGESEPEVVPSIAYLGRLGPVKGVAHLLDACERLAGEGRAFTLELLVKDPDEYPHEYRSVTERIRRGPLAGRANVVGFVEDLAARLPRFTVGVVPSVGSEANCRTAVEFLACGVPVVVTAVGTLPEVVGEGRAGLTVPPADAGALAEGLASMLDNRKMRTAMAGRTRGIVEELFSLDRMIDRSAELLGALVGKGTP